MDDRQWQSLQDRVHLVGICGKKRHGKNTVGDLLQAFEAWTPIAFADPIKRIAMDIYGLSYEQCFGGDEHKEAVDPRWGLTPRSIMQRIGTEVARSIHKDTWVRYCLSEIERASRGEAVSIHWAPSRKFMLLGEGRTLSWPSWALPMNAEGEPYGGREDRLINLKTWAVTDVRFPNEADHIRRAGGKIIKVVRPSLEGMQTDSHASETNIDKIDADFLLTNDGTLDDLASKVEGLLPELPR